MLHAADRVALRPGLGAARDLEEGEQRIVAHVEEVMADLLVRRIAAISRPAAEPGRHLHGVHQRHADDARVEVHRRAHVFRIQRQVMNATGGKLYRLRLATGQCFALHDFSFLSTRTVAIAFATSVPSSFFASASTKLMLRPSFITRASA